MPNNNDDTITILSDAEASAVNRTDAVFNFLATYVEEAFRDAGTLPPYLVFEITSYLNQATEHPTPPPAHLIDMMFEHMAEVAQPVEFMPSFDELADWVRTVLFDTLYDVELIPLNPFGITMLTNNLPKRTLGDVLKEILNAIKVLQATKKLDMPDGWDLVARPFRRYGPFKLLATDTLISHRSIVVRAVRTPPTNIQSFSFRERMRAPSGTVMVTANLIGSTQMLSDKQIPRNLIPQAGTNQITTDQFSGGGVRIAPSFSSLVSDQVTLSCIIQDSFGRQVGDLDKTFLTFMLDVRLEYWSFD